MAISTLELSTDWVTRLPAPLVPGCLGKRVPESVLAVNAWPFWRCNLSGALNVTTGTCAIVRDWPLS